MPTFDRSLFAVGLGVIGSIAGGANATWSILITDTRTGEIVIGSATCVELIDLQQSTPVLISGVGAVTAQSAVDTSGMNRQLIRDRLLQGVPLDAILDELSISDSGHDNRQYGMIDTFGDTLTYSGVENAAWAGGLTGRIERGVPGPADDIVYAVQGNILSGGNVVEAAVDAIIASDGDLPQMMMEAMQAAKVAGGDGRCSCSSADPTGCGSPPPAPFKSADVGYMLGTRAGDIDAIRGIYPIDGFVGAIETMDLDGDGFEEVIVGNRDTNDISIFRNTSSAGVPLSSLEHWQTIEAPASGIVDIGVGFPEPDGSSRFVVILQNPPSVCVYESDGNGSIKFLDTSSLQSQPTDIVELLSNNYIVSQEGSNTISFVNTDRDSDFIEFATDLPFAANALWVDQVGPNSSSPEVIAVDTLANAVQVFEFEEVGFQFAASISTDTNPIQVKTADMDQDGDNEVLVLTGTGRSVQIFNFENDAWTQWASINIGGIGIGMDVGDMNGDGFPDVVSSVQATNRNLRLWISDGQGGFSLQTRTRVGNAARSIALTDMNNNGDLDIVVGHAGDEAVVLLDNPRGGELPQPGRFAAGEYFMALNVPNQRRADPDPVDQLQDLYDAWRLDREGRVDAVQSIVSGPGVILFGQTQTFTLELRDLHGELLEIADPAQIDITVRAPSASARSPIMIEPGLFEFEVISGGNAAYTHIVVEVESGDATVRLMPDFAVALSQFGSDWNADGVCNFFDISLYISAYLSGDIRADIIGDGFLNFLDVSAFLNFYNSCVGG